MALHDALKDIVEHTHALGFIEMVKVIGTAADAKIETIDADKSVVIYGEMYQPIVGIETTVGLSRLAVLKGYLGFHKNSTIKVINESRGGIDVPAEINFVDEYKSKDTYRLMSESMINEQVKVPPFRGATWNITFAPGTKEISRLSERQGLLGGFEKRFTVSVDGAGDLRFNIGSGPTDRSDFVFASGVSGTLKHQWTYPLTQVLSILKLSGDFTMSFSDMGAMKIDIDSGVGKYTYIIPAGKN